MRAQIEEEYGINSDGLYGSPVKRVEASVSPTKSPKKRAINLVKADALSEGN